MSNNYMLEIKRDCLILTKYLVYFVIKFLLAFLILANLRECNNQFFFSKMKQAYSLHL